MTAVQQSTPVLVKMPSGDWCQFSCETKARSFVVDIDDSTLIHGPNDLARLGYDDLAREYLRLVKMPYSGHRHDTAIAIELWGLLLSHAKQPLAAFDGKSSVDGKVLGKRASLVYKCQYTGKDGDPLKAAFENLPHQAKICLLIVKELEEKHSFVDSKLLERELVMRVDELKTKQKTWRVFKYYQSLMIGEGLLRLQRR